MIRARHGTRALLVLSGLLGGEAGPAFAGGGAVSPTQALAQIARANPNGATVYPTFGHDRDRSEAADRTLAPYLMVAGGTSDGADRLPLKETSADVAIAGVIAHVQVHQLFENRGSQPLEAVYVFPASTRAAVHGVRMKIGARVVEANIAERQTARQTYEAARRDGRRASLLEQERPNVFTMSVANIMPGDRIAVELDYSEMLVPQDATYEFVYPAVVGPRYAGGADPAQDGWIANPHLRAGAPEPYRFDVRVHLESGIPIQELSSPSHEVQVAYASPASADVRLAGPGGGNRDFVLRYRLAGDQIETGALLWHGGGRDEGFFAVMMEPPRRPVAAQIPPREYIFLLDVSGSMHGFPLDTAKVLMRNLLARLRPTDLFNVVQFSGAAHVMSPGGSIPARPGEVAHAVAEVERLHGGGGTELMGGLQLAYGIPRRDEHVSRTVVVVTDGFVGVEAQAFRFIRERLGQANLFAFGIGSSVNRGLIEGMARAGQGEPFVVLGPDKAAAEADKLRAMVEQPVLTGIQVAFSGLDAREVAPQTLPDLLAQRPLILFGKYRGTPSGTITITGRNGAGAVRQVIPIGAANVHAENAALRWLWARRWVDTLEDERALGAGEPAERALTALGLEYHLLTAFTSFVAVDAQVVNAGGQGQTVRQPLPMPQGVSDLAAAPDENERFRGASPAPMAKREVLDDRLELRIGAGRAWPAPKRKSAGPAWALVVDQSTGLAAPTVLATAIRTALDRRRDLAPAGCATLKLRLTIDAHGKVLGVDRLSGDPALAARLRPLLLALPPVPAASPGGTLEISLRGSCFPE